MLAAGYYESGDREPRRTGARERRQARSERSGHVHLRNRRRDRRLQVRPRDRQRAGSAPPLARPRRRLRPLSANRDAGSLLNNAFRLQGLNAWGRFYGDAVFDPFSGSGFVDQAVSGSPDPFVNDLDYGTDALEPVINNAGFSSFFQGLLLDPQMISGRSRSANLFRRPFLEGSIGGGFVANEGDDAGWTAKRRGAGLHYRAPSRSASTAVFPATRRRTSREQSYLTMAPQPNVIHAGGSRISAAPATSPPSRRPTTASSPMLMSRSDGQL